MSKPKRGELTIRDRILNSALYRGENPFSTAQMNSRMQEKTNSGISAAFREMEKDGTLERSGVVRNVQMWVKPAKKLSTNPLHKPWVSAPSPTECTPAYC